MRIVTADELTDEFFTYKEPEELDTVRTILQEVREKGDRAVKRYTLEFDHVVLEKLRVEGHEFREAVHVTDTSVADAIDAAARNITQFAERQFSQLTAFEMEIAPGVFAGQQIIPIDRVGVYVPGGQAPLLSTLLMCCIPAVVAGVKEIAVCSPPTYEGTIHPALLTAAARVGVDELYKVGGVQAIGAMAYGTESIKKVDKIVGPGNTYVTAAKKQVLGAVGIDFLAGPTELMIIADETADPAIVAADLLAQAEHDDNALPLLVTPSVTLAERVATELQHQLEGLPTRSTAEKAIAHGAMILTEGIDEAVKIANKRAPEHLELQLRDPDQYIPCLRNYGSLFVGSFAAEALGDYSSGLNHTLPTNTGARYTGGLSAIDFVKLQTTLRVTKTGIEKIGSIARMLAETEGLYGHARSLKRRMEK